MHTETSIKMPASREWQDDVSGERIKSSCGELPAVALTLHFP
jgi:hypothetical protein